MVAGPPLEVQVRVLDSLLNVSSVMLGAPALKIIYLKNILSHNNVLKFVNVIVVASFQAPGT